jgi:hypothetical protein
MNSNMLNMSRNLNVQIHVSEYVSPCTTLSSFKLLTLHLYVIYAALSRSRCKLCTVPPAVTCKLCTVQGPPDEAIPAGRPDRSRPPPPCGRSAARVSPFVHRLPHACVQGEPLPAWLKRRRWRGQVPQPQAVARGPGPGDAFAKTCEVRAKGSGRNAALARCSPVHEQGTPSVLAYSEWSSTILEQSYGASCPPLCIGLIDLISRRARTFFFFGNERGHEF